MRSSYIRVDGAHSVPGYPNRNLKPEPHNWKFQISHALRYYLANVDQAAVVVISAPACNKSELSELDQIKHGTSLGEIPKIALVTPDDSLKDR